MKFTEEQVKELVWDSLVDEGAGARRWSESMVSICEFEGKFYSIEWERGLTECQENEFYAQDAPEVHKVEKGAIASQEGDLV